MIITALNSYGLLTQMKKIFVFVFITNLLFSVSYADNATQIVRGIVIDKDSRTPLVGVSISVLNTNPIIATSSDVDGNFKMAAVPVGRQSIKATYLGYQDFLISEIYINSAKEQVLTIEMVQAVVQKDEV